MKVTAFNGSPRKDGNTAALIRHVFAALEAEGIETELVQVGGNLIHGCKACYWNMGFGREKGAVENDEEGVRTMKVLGENMAWLMKKLG